MSAACAFRSICVLNLLFAVIPAASAATDAWISNVSGNFTDAANWGSGVPGTTDNLVFDRGGGITYTVTFPGQPIAFGVKNYSTGSVAVAANNVTFAPSSSFIFGPSFYTVPAITIGDVPSTPSILNTTLQSLATATATIGLGSGSPGTLNVIGGSTSVTGSTADYELVIGNDGSGSALKVAAGAQLNVNGTLGNAVIGKKAGVTGTATVTGASASWSNTSNDPTAPLTIGGLGTGVLNVTTGGHVDDFDADIAGAAGSTGTAFVDGAGSNWTNRGTLYVGNLSSGSLTISNGGQVTDNASVIAASPGATGGVTVTGVGAKWTQASTLRLGSNSSSNNVVGTGSLHILAGGQVTTTGDANVGSVGSGTVRLEGSDSKWTIGGALNVTASSRVDILAPAIATSNSAVDRGTVSVDGANAIWNVGDTLSVTTGAVLGSATPAAVDVGDGAHVTSRVAYVGTGSGSGQAFVDGAGSTWTTADQIYIGVSGGGQFNVTGGGQVNSRTVQLGVLPNDVGTVTVDASTWTNSAEFDVGVGGMATLTVVSGGTLSSADTLSVGPRGTVQGNGQISANLRNGGTLAPGASSSPNNVGTLHLSGGYTQTAAGALTMQLASATSFDKLVITGSATLGGALNVSLVGGFTPAVGQSFDLLNAMGGITGQYSSITLPSLLTGGHGPFWTLVYTNTDVILRLITSPTGDYNHNGVVDAADYVVWRDELGQTGFSLPADGDGDNTITQNDYNIWRSNFGNHSGSGSGAIEGAPVPEPATSVMLMFAAAGWCLRRRRPA